MASPQNETLFICKMAVKTDRALDFTCVHPASECVFEDLFSYYHHHLKAPMLTGSEIQLLKKTMGEEAKSGQIRRWCPTRVLVSRFSTYLWQNGRNTLLSPA